jgi:NAD(P)-dependent dehydrogenase (short-subunit alcohol dehydrogenase family)
MGTAEEVADACAFLLGDQAAYFSGSTLYMTGGVMAGTI